MPQQQQQKVTKQAAAVKPAWARKGAVYGESRALEKVNLVEPQLTALALALALDKPVSHGLWLMITGSDSVYKTLQLPSNQQHLWTYIPIGITFQRTSSRKFNMSKFSFIALIACAVAYVLCSHSAAAQVIGRGLLKNPSEYKSAKGRGKELRISKCISFVLPLQLIPANVWWTPIWLCRSDRLPRLPIIRAPVLPAWKAAPSNCTRAKRWRHPRAASCATLSTPIVSSLNAVTATTTATNTSKCLIVRYP